MANYREYMDVESALNRIGGNATLYKKLLKIFLTETHVEELGMAINNDDNEQIARLAHTVKGVCANLSLDNLKLVATDIEARIKDGLECKSFLPTLTESYNQTAVVINDYINR